MTAKRVQIYYDGQHGALRVSLRGGMTALDLSGPGIRTVNANDAEDLRSPLLGGGAFWQALTLPEAAARFGVKARELGRFAADGEVTSISYQAPGAAAAEPYIVLDTKTMMRMSATGREK